MKSTRKVTAYFRRHTGRAYTLVESGVLIAVLVGVVGLVVPSLKPARQQAPRTATQPAPAPSVAGIVNEACCSPTGRCELIDPRTCRAQGGVPLGPDADCEGDGNQNDVDDACELDGPCDDCGGVDHWVDRCPGGADHMPSGARLGLDLNLDCITDLTLILGGSATIVRSAPLDASLHFAGTGVLDQHLDVIDTEIVAMNLTGGGTVLRAGQGNGVGGEIRPSRGAVVEQSGDPLAADSFFDVFVELQMAAGGGLYNHDPLKVVSKIDCVPPDALYLHPAGCTPLYTSPVLGQGVHTANLVAAVTDTFPKCGSPAAGDCSTPHDSPFCNKAECCERVCEIASSCCTSAWSANCVGIAADVCASLPVACCLPGGACEPTLPETCTQIGGVPVSEGEVCRGDNDGDRIDDACGARPCEQCGPGPHWIHQPPCPPGGSGQDTIPSGAVAGIDLDDDCIADLNLVLGGPVTIGKRGPFNDSLQYPGLRPVDNHLDVIDTEILAMDLTGGGVTLRAGAGAATVPLRQSTGAIAELPNDPSQADSFFDVFFEITNGPNVRAYNLIPVKVATRITCLPPDGLYAHITGCTPLFSSPVAGQGTFVGNLVSADHFTYPACCSGAECVKDVPTEQCQTQGGTVVPDCLGDNDNNSIDDACECGPTPDGTGCRQGVCATRVEPCLPSCVTFNPFTGRSVVEKCECAATSACHATVPAEGPPHCEGGCGPTEVCLDSRTANSDGSITVCCACAPPATEACCLPDGRCADLPVDRCREAGGEPGGANTQCAGDANNNGIDDFCEDQPCKDCGPGPHWMHNPPCPPGTDHIPTGAVVGLDTNLDCVVDRNLVLQGPSAVRRTGPLDDSSQFPGTRPVDGHFDVIDTEMLSLNLTGGGATLTAGGGLGLGGILTRTRGAIAEQPSDATLADSFFDVFFEVDLGGGNRLYNQSPLRVSAVINCVPPNAIYVHPHQCVPLYTSPIPGQGVHVSNLVSANHTTFPQPPQACCLLDGTCQTTFPEVCRERRGRPQGVGTTCDNTVCPAVEVDHFPNATAVMQLQIEGKDSTSIALSGLTTVHVFFEGPLEGDAQDDDGDGFDEVETQIVDMQLTGQSPLLGPVLVRLHPAKPSLGLIEERDNEQAGRLDVPPFVFPGLTADSFFDVFFEVRAAGRVFHTQTPKRMGGIITHKPPDPGNVFENPDKIPLLDENGEPTGMFIGAGRHFPRPVVEVDTFDSSSAVVELVFPDGDRELVSLSGPTTVHVLFEGANEGDALDHDGNGLDEVGTEMVELKLTGVSPTFGPIQVRLHPAKPSVGLIEERANTQPGRLDLPPFAPTGTANSFFDVFVEIELMGQVLHTQTPKRMSSRITHKPPAPGDGYENPDNIPLLDANGNPTGFFLGAGRHVPRPLGACCLATGACVELTPDRCRDAGGTGLGAGSRCEGDANGNQQDDVCEPDRPCEECGSFPHWVDQCPGGVDSMPTSALVGIDLSGDCLADASAVMFGPAFVRRSSPLDDSLQFPGSRPMDKHLDVLDTEIVSLELTGGGLTLRAGEGAGLSGPIRRTRGAILEDPSNAMLADSFFDVFFEVEIGGGLLAYNHQAVQVQSKIDCVPPDTTYIHVLECVPLFDSPVGGNRVANLVRAAHGTYPQCGELTTGDCFEPHDTPFCNNGECCERVCAVVPQCCDAVWNPLCAALARDLCEPTQACCLPNGGCKDVAAAVCELAGGEPRGEKSSCHFAECPRAGDCNRDGHTDLRDVAKFMNCYTGPNGQISRDCRCADLDMDDDVDGQDWRSFLPAMTGP